MEAWIMTAFRETIGIALPSSETEFFSSGIDSLKAIQMRRLILKTLDLKGPRLSPNIVYEKANAGELARHLFALSQGEDIQLEDESILAQQLIEKYSVVERHRYRSGLDYSVNGDFLTGTTGSIGAHVLSQMLSNPTITKIYCPVRGSNPLQRVFASLSSRNLDVAEQHQHKIFAFESNDLNDPAFGLDPSTFALLKRECSLIVHIAWPVNFNLPLRSFEPHIRGLHNLLSLSTSVKRPQPARLFFASSISVALNSAASATVPNALQTDFRKVSPTGYARSKFVGEHVVCRAAGEAGADACVLRIGQVVGDTREGIWNDQEFLPMMIRSSLVLGPCSWLPVDTLATVILQLADTETLAPSSEPNHDAAVYNLVNPHTFSWGDLLDELHARGLRFSAKPFAEWLSLLNASASKDEEENNPAVKLLEYFKTNYLADAGNHSGDEGIRFDTSAAERKSRALREAPRCLEGGLLGMFVARWIKRWGWREGGFKGAKENGHNFAARNTEEDKNGTWGYRQLNSYLRTGSLLFKYWAFSSKSPGTLRGQSQTPDAKVGVEPQNRGALKKLAAITTKTSAILQSRLVEVNTIESARRSHTRLSE
ncbi:MAG: hypothetical protein Q9206_003971 [Seirophora lacunosa]